MTMRGVAVGVKTGTPIPSGCVISDAWVTLPGSSARVTQVAIGTKFIIHCAFSATNQGGGQWTVGISAIGVGVSSIQNWASENSGTFGGTYINKSDELVNVLGDNTMPDGSGVLQIRLKMWMKDGISSTMDMPTDVSKW